jgi:hypothetical protein
MLVPDVAELAVAAEPHSPSMAAHDPANDDGTPAPIDIESAAGKCRARRSDQNGQCDPCAHGFGFQFPEPAK